MTAMSQSLDLLFYPLQRGKIERVPGVGREQGDLEIHTSFFITGISLLYNVVLVSAVEQSESAVCVHICPLPLEPPSQPRLHPTPLSHHRPPSWVPVLYGSFPLTIYFTHGSVYVWASLVAQMVKNLLAMQETWVQFLGQEDPLEEKMATHSSILAWRIPWTEEPGGLQSMGWQRVESNWATNSFSIHM